jgi:hypothetical protein
MSLSVDLIDAHVFVAAEDDEDLGLAGWRRAQSEVRSSQETGL